jgi:hypothetical protein
LPRLKRRRSPGEHRTTTLRAQGDGDEERHHPQADGSCGRGRGCLDLHVLGVRATRPDDRSGVRGPGATVATQVESGEPGLAARPDNRAGVLGVGADASVPAATSDGFDWTAAGIGAGATGAFVLLVGVAAMLAMPRRQRAIA